MTPALPSLHHIFSWGAIPLPHPQGATIGILGDIAKKKIFLFLHKEHTCSRQQICVLSVGLKVYGDCN
jgi:hypothetical protein